MNNTLRNSFRNQKGGFDLSSIMVGLIVLGIAAGVVAATVFLVIPWTQDKAAKDQLENIKKAENAYATMSEDNKTTTYANLNDSSSQLAKTGLIPADPTKYCAITADSGNTYSAFILSDTGKVWTLTDKTAAKLATDNPCGF